MHGIEEEQEDMRTSCPMHADLRANYSNLDDDEVLVKFFREVLERRDKINDEQRSRGGQARRRGVRRYNCVLPRLRASAADSMSLQGQDVLFSRLYL